MLTLARQETADISDKQELKLVEDAARDVNDMVCAAVQEALAGHQYLSVTAF